MSEHIARALLTVLNGISTNVRIMKVDICKHHGKFVSGNALYW